MSRHINLTLLFEVNSIKVNWITFKVNVKVLWNLPNSHRSLSHVRHFYEFLHTYENRLQSRNSAPYNRALPHSTFPLSNTTSSSDVEQHARCKITFVEKKVFVVFNRERFCKIWPAVLLLANPSCLAACSLSLRVSSAAAGRNGAQAPVWCSEQHPDGIQQHTLYAGVRDESRAESNRKGLPKSTKGAFVRQQGECSPSLFLLWIYRVAILLQLGTSSETAWSYTLKRGNQWWRRIWFLLLVL